MTPAPRCTASRRRLKRPTATGLGPVCEKRLNPSVGTTFPAAASSGPIPVIDGQAELPIGMDPYTTNPPRRSTA